MKQDNQAIVVVTCGGEHRVVLGKDETVVLRTGRTGNTRIWLNLEQTALVADLAKSLDYVVCLHGNQHLRERRITLLALTMSGLSIGISITAILQSL